MAVIGLLEGNRLRTVRTSRMGNPVRTPADWASSPGNSHDRELMTTDWPALYTQNPAAAQATFATVLQSSSDPEGWPHIKAFMDQFNLAFQPDPGSLNPAPTPGTAAVYTNNPPPISDADYAASAAAMAKEAERLATLPRDAVTGPAFQPEPAAIPDGGGRAGEGSAVVTVTVPDGGGRAPDGSVPEHAASNGAEKKSMLPLLAAAAAAYLFLKG